MWAFDEGTTYPANIKIPQSHVHILDEFFRVADLLTPEPDAGEQFRDVFTSDGVWKTPFATYTGVNEVQKSGHLWTDLRKRKSMRHWVKKVYANDTEGKELMMIGRIRVESLEGDVRDVNFGAHIVIVDDDGSGKDGPRIKLFQGWSSAQ